MYHVLLMVDIKLKGLILITIVEDADQAFTIERAIARHQDVIQSVSIPIGGTLG